MTENRVYIGYEVFARVPTTVPDKVSYQGATKTKFELELMPGAHLTLAYLGNLISVNVETLQQVAEILLTARYNEVLCRFERMAMFGPHKDLLVAVYQSNVYLNDAREALDTAGLPIVNDFEFTPHVTMPQFAGGTMNVPKEIIVMNPYISFNGARFMIYDKDH